jgi:hypothetical protein
MVILHVKKGDDNQYLYETSTAILIEDLTRELVGMHNMRGKVDRAS